jgi:phosphate/sulfate permease
MSLLLLDCPTGVAGNMLIAWVFTIPITFTLSAAVYAATKAAFSL